MSTRNLLPVTVVLAGLLLLAFAGSVLAEDAKKAPPKGDDEALFPGLHSEVQFTGEGYGGPNEAAKFQEYRDLPQGGQVDWLRVDYETEDKGYNADLKVKNAGLEDMDLLFTSEQYGKWKASFEFNRIPHRFFDEVGTIFAGQGTGKLRVPDALQAAEQASPSDAAMVTTLRQALHDSQVIDEIALQRDQLKLHFTFIQLDPFTMGVDLSHEWRHGDRPIGGGFGFSNSIQLIEPIDYYTDNATLWMAYDQDKLHLKVFYAFDFFQNNIGALSWDNPFRNVDSTAASAYAQSRQNGAREGKMALYPDTLENSVGFEFGYDLPAKTHVTAGFTAGWREQDEEFLAYSDNTAIRTGAVSGVAGVLVPFDAFNKANLPQGGLDGQVETQRANFQVTNRAIDHLDIRARYRFQHFDNTSDEITFPGYARVDAVWEPEELTTERPQWWRHEGGIEFAYTFPCHTTLTLGYKFVDMEREEREVDSSWDHILLASVDSKAVSWLDARTSYEHTWRRTDGYDPLNEDATTTNGFGTVADMSGNLPFLRKYDESEFDRDKVNVQFTFPTEKISPTAGYTLILTNYDANFGLTDDTRHAVNAGFDSDPWTWMHASVIGNFEWSYQDQTSRQWNPMAAATAAAPNGRAGTSGVGDPFETDTGDFSFSNWDASIFDRTLTFNSQTIFHLIADKLDLELKHTWMHAGEGVGFDSPVGAPVPGATPPGGFTLAQDQSFDNNPNNVRLFGLGRNANATWNNLRVQFRWKVKKNLTVVFGYLWERFDSENGRNQGFTATETTPAGAYAGWLGLNTEPNDYESHAGFVSVVWNF